MKIKLKNFLVTASLFIGLPCFSNAGSIQKVADLDAMKTQAAQNKKLVVVFVTSSDPDCHECSRMRNDFLGDREFMDWVGRFSVFGEFDGNIRGKSAEQIQGINTMLQAIRAPFTPSMVLLNSNGELLEYQPADHVPSQAATLFHQIYMAKIGGIHSPNNAPVTLGAPANQPGGGQPAGPAWAPLNAVPVRYDSLALRSITGSGARRFVLINDQTLAVGEAGKVTLNGQKVLVRLVEIRDEQAVVQVQGESNPRLLVLERSRSPRTAAK